MTSPAGARTRVPHIAVDARMIGHSGIGTYIRNLLPAIAAHRPRWRWTLLGNGAALSALPWPDAVEVRIKEGRSAIYTMFGGSEPFL